MDLIAQLAAAVEYVESRLDGDITPERAGKEAGMSPFHFQRTFSVIAGVSFAEYVRRRRLTLAAREIAEGRPILETALTFGWESQAAFAFGGAFRRLGHPRTCSRMPLALLGRHPVVQGAPWHHHPRQRPR